MRQWMIPVKCLCNKHLRGEHVEHHMFASVLGKGKKVDGYLKSPSGERLLWPGHLRARHDQIAAEMVQRGDKHDSPFLYAEQCMPVPPLGWNWFYEAYTQDMINNFREVARRCPDCRTRVIAAGYGELIRGVPLGGDYYVDRPARVPGEAATIDVYISGRCVGWATTKAKALVLMEKMRRQMRLDGTIWN